MPPYRDMADGRDTPSTDGDIALGVRDGHERRHRDRRRRDRFNPDRRSRERRRARTRTLLLAAAALTATGQAKTHTKYKPIQGSVSVSLHDFRPVRPEEAYEALIQEAAAAYELSPDLIRAVMRTESSFNPFVVSPVGAQGLMQLMPALAKEMGVTDAFDPRQNVMGGAKYLRQLLDRHRGNVPLTLASYNAGPGNVAKYKGVPPFRETRNYVRKITGLLAEAGSDAAE